ncbi:CD276 antigen homolog [Stegastes partitus]|uniref:CD276 antigen homolog n=1 Tax=Stegastes partitus TaxID=144197 RepID=A0A9Y4KI10_9TELE|nr:PREDICTED: CD276 antigen homolog [Stegastes partitus]
MKVYHHHRHQTDELTVVRLKLCLFVCSSAPLLLLLLCCLDSATGVEVSGVVGGSAVLPCVYSEDDLPSSVSVYWRDKDDRGVMDVVRNSENTKSQHQRFRGRVTSFPELYSKGNFSVRMTDLKLEDEGPYECEVVRVNFKRKVTLKVSGKLTALATSPPSGAAADWLPVHLTLMPALLLTGFTLF